jgi:hypothetical protein
VATTTTPEDARHESSTFRRIGVFTGAPILPENRPGEQTCIREPVVAPAIIGRPVVASEKSIMSSGNNYSWSFSIDCEADVRPYLNVNAPVKFYVLDLIDRRQELTYADLAEETGMPSEYAADRLVKYARKGLLKRSREGDGGISTFTMTRRGADRLAHFRRQG